MALYVQYGCGFCSPEGWLNFDASPTLRLQKIPVMGRWAPVKFPASVRYGDIRKGLPVADGSADGVYCSHVLEHLALEDFRKALKNTFRILRPGGVFRLVLPDLKLLAREYLGRSEPDAAIRFMESTLMGRLTRPKGMSGLLRSWIGNSEHLWMWDYEALAMELDKVGFTSIRPAVFGDSGDAMFAKVEDQVRWTSALGMQSQRP
jgi:SAM-dependent methyltransferase